MEEREIQKRIKSGSILAQVSFEVIGNPKDYVEKTIKDFVENIRNDQGITILSEEYGDAEELEGGLFSTYVDTELLSVNLDKFNWLCVNFMPASIEIIAPEEMRIKDKDLTNWFNDLLAKLHDVTARFRTLSEKEEAFIKSMNAMVQNSVLLAAEHYHDPKQICQKIGIELEQLNPFFEALVKSKKLEKKGEGYYRKV
jgi:hypothetical protein